MQRACYPMPKVGRLYRPKGLEISRSRGPRVLIFVRTSEGPGARWFRTHRRAIEEAAAKWGGGLEVLADEPTSTDDGWLAVLDEWDEVFHVTAFGERWPPLTLDEVGEWVRFVATQCEECERAEWPWRH